MKEKEEHSLIENIRNINIQCWSYSIRLVYHYTYLPVLLNKNISDVIEQKIDVINVIIFRWDLQHTRQQIY